MIDEKTAMQWAKDAGLTDSLAHEDRVYGTLTEIQALVTRAMNEAYEMAAINIESTNYAMKNILACDIRALKQDPQK